jgi:uncharacterized repeat protein (TIGR03803 family)
VSQFLRKPMIALFAGALVLSFAFDNLSAQTYTDLHDFNRSTEGCCPQYPAILAQGRDGNLYGTMSLGGTYNYGTVFKATPDGTVTVLYTFDGNLGNGVNSQSGLTLGTDGNFYGTTAKGGLGAGTIFKITPAGAIQTLYSFTGNASSPPMMAVTPSPLPYRARTATTTE